MFDLAFESVLYSQTNGNRQLHLVDFHLWKFEVVEINYKIDDKKFLDMVVIVGSFRRSYHFLEGSSHKLIMYNDHKKLIDFKNV